MLLPLSLPSPADGVWDLGPLPLRGYALAIVLGIVVAVWTGERRWVARGGRPGEVVDLAIWAVPFGLVGGRLYHVLTDHELYFGESGKGWVHAFAIWEGGLGVWGAIMLGAVGVMIGARTKGMRLWPVLDAVAPACLLAQGIGRWGNWFNQELFGRPTDLPWGLEIDPAHYPQGPTQFAPGTTFHPTFLYEFLWCLVAFALVVWLDRRLRLGGGRVVALYVMTYTFGRFFIEGLRIDTVQLHDVLGLRWSDWMAIILFTLAALWWVYATVTGRGRREEQVYTAKRQAEIDAEVAAEDAPEDATDDAAERRADDQQPGPRTDADAGGTGAERTRRD